MRASSTLLVFVLAAVSASPALAAPVNTGFCNRYPGACSHIGRDVQAPADSEAISFGTIFDIGKGIFDVGKTLFGGSSQQQQQRDVSGAINLSQLRGPELGPPVAFKGADGVWRQFGTGAPTTPPQGLQRREFVEFMARATAEADESGSLGLGTIFDIGKGIFDVGKEIFGGNSQQQSREFEEFMARATAEADESGSLGLGTIFDIGKGIFDVGKEIFSGNSNQQSREFEDLLARAATETDETGSLGLGTIFDIGKGIFDVGKTLFGGNSNQQSREFVEMMARSDEGAELLRRMTLADLRHFLEAQGPVRVATRADADDESGALGLGTIFDIGKGIFDVGKTIFGGNSNQQSREFVEMMARSDEGAELLRRMTLAEVLRDRFLGAGPIRAYARADADDESGALGLGTIFDIGKGIFDVGKEIFGGNNQQQSRELVEMLARSDEGAELLRRLSLADVLKSHPFLGHGPVVFPAREFADLD